MNKIFLSITLIIVLLVTMICSIFAEPISGKIIIENSNQSAEYVDVGIMGKGIGTNGKRCPLLSGSVLVLK
jgi:hypothetical protein